MSQQMECRAYGHKWWPWSVAEMPPGGTMTCERGCGTSVHRSQDGRTVKYRYKIEERAEQ